MHYPIGRHSVAPAVAVLLLATAGCSSNAQRPPRDDATAQIETRCPAGHNLICEARKTSRIRHGSFGHNYEKCACAPEGFDLPRSPVIPRF